MSDLIEIKARTKTGSVQTFSVAEILEINGQRYHPPEDFEGLRDHLVHHDGRLTAIEAIIGKDKSNG